ncbi:hypothetical protein EPN44_15615 [bacterium]|nr:MAG: hypothetical protein EPN44_15615 [bacterium]
MRVLALAFAFALLAGGLPATAAELTFLALPPVSDRQPWASAVEGDADLPGLGGYDVRAFARVAASLTDSFSLGVPGRASTLLDTSFHFFQLGITLSRTYFGRYDLYAGGGYAWAHSSYHTDNFAGYGTSAQGGTTANGPTLELGVRVPLGQSTHLQAGVMALFSTPTGEVCDTASHCAAPDTRSVLTYPYLGVGLRF